MYKIKDKLTLCSRLDEARKNEGQIVTWIKSVPECARYKRGHAGTEARFLAARRNAKIHIISKPIVGVDIPIAEIGSGVLCTFHSPWIYILESIPRHFAGDRIYPSEAQAGENAGAFRKSPDTVIFEARSKIEHMKNPDSIKETVCHVFVPGEEFRVVPARELKKY